MVSVPDRLECWTKSGPGGPYVVCEGSKGQSGTYKAKNPRGPQDIEGNKKKAKKKAADILKRKKIRLAKKETKEKSKKKSTKSRSSKSVQSSSEIKKAPKSGSIKIVDNRNSSKVGLKRPVMELSLSSVKDRLDKVYAKGSKKNKAFRDKMERGSDLWTNDGKILDELGL